MNTSFYSANFSPIENIEEPLEIKFLSLLDRFQTTVGFEFTYTGIEEQLTVNELDDIFRTIYDHNKRNPHFTKDLSLNCPLFNDYLHDLRKIEIMISTEEDYANKMVVFEFKIFQESELFVNDRKDIQKNTTISLKNNISVPKYVFNYAYQLAMNIKSLRHSYHESNTAMQ